MRNIKLFFLLVVFNNCLAQTDIYTRIYQSADSLAIKGKIGVLENEVYEAANSLSDKHPMEYFKTSGEYIKQQKFNEASFLFYLGYLRYKYYNSSNPDYQASGDGALAGSLSAMLGEPINMYLRSNIENFISILNSTIQFNQTNNYIFYPKEKDLEKYNIQVRHSTDMLEDMKSNKAKYAKEWKKERKEIQKLLRQ